MMPHIPRDLPPDYLEFIRAHNGGWLGDVNVWTISEVVEQNVHDRLKGYPKEFFMFGSTDGESYGFDLRPGCKMAIVSMSGTIPDWDYALYRAPAFLDLMRMKALEDEWHEANEKVLDAAVDEWIEAGKASEPPPSAASPLPEAPSAERGFVGLVKRFFARRQ